MTAVICYYAALAESDVNTLRHNQGLGFRLTIISVTKQGYDIYTARDWRFWRRTRDRLHND